MVYLTSLIYLVNLNFFNVSNFILLHFDSLSQNPRRVYTLQLFDTALKTHSIGFLLLFLFLFLPSV